MVATRDVVKLPHGEQARGGAVTKRVVAIHLAANARAGIGGDCRLIVGAIDRCTRDQIDNAAR